MVTFDVMQGAGPAQAPLRQQRLPCRRTALPSLRSRRDVEPQRAGSGRSAVRGGPARSDPVRRAGAPARRLRARPPGCCRMPVRRPRPEERPASAAAPPSTRCRRAPSSRSSGPRCSTPRPRTEPREMPADGEHYRATVDFHQMVGSLGDHPDLQRRLGLVVDLAVPADALPAPTGFVTATPALAAACRRGGPRERRPPHRIQRRRRPVRRRPADPGPDGPGGTGAAVGDRLRRSTRSTSTELPSRPSPPPRPRPPPAVGRRRPALHQPDDAGLASLRTAGLVAGPDRPRRRAAGRVQPQWHASTAPSRPAQPSCSPRTWSGATGWTSATTSPASGARCTNASSRPLPRGMPPDCRPCRVKGTCRSAWPSG